jgi:protoporphyrinogen oxidase
MPNIVVLGSGMAGFGAAQRLKSEGIRPILYEKAPYFGGHTASFRDEAGFWFDLGPHISFTKDARIQELLAGYVEQKYEAVQVKLDNYWRGLKLTHPVQLHLNGLPHDLIVEIIADFVKIHEGEARPVANYEDWLVASYGRKFAETFPMQYTRKYHLTSASNMTTDWLGPRMYRPTLEELLRGALAPWQPDVHYITNFRYPTRGGFVSYLRHLPAMADIRLNHELVAVDPTRRMLRFANDVSAPYDALVSSIALPDLGADGGGRSCRRCRSQSPAGLLDVRAGQRGRGSQRSVRGAHHLLLRRRPRLHAHRLPSHAFAQQRPGRMRQHPGGGLFFEQVPSPRAAGLRGDRSRDRRPAADGHAP